MTPADPGGYVVTAGQMYQEVRDLARTMDRVEGKIDSMAARADRTEQDLKQLRLDTETDIKGIRTDVEELKRSRWPLTSVAGLTAAAGLGITAYQLVAR